MYRGLAKDPDTQFSSDIAMLQMLCLMLEPIQIIKQQHPLNLHKSKRRISIPSSSQSRNISASQLLQEFKNQSLRQTADKQSILASFGSQNPKMQSAIKNQFIQFQATKQNLQNKKQQCYRQTMSNYKRMHTNTNNECSYSTFKQQNQIKESVVTFSPLKIDISLPSLTSEDLDQLKQEKQYINEIQNDIKQLIQKIKSNQCPQQSPTRKQKITKLSKFIKSKVK